MYQPKNRMTDGGDTWEVDGKLVFGETAEIEGLAVSPVVDNLTSEDSDKALSANQGKVLKGLVDGKYTAALATESTAGLVKAAAKGAGEEDVVEAKIGQDGKLYVPAYPAIENMAPCDAVENLLDYVNGLVQAMKDAGVMMPDEEV